MDKSTPKLTPAMEQWHQMKSQHPDKVLLFRMGDFYELFYEDAIKCSKLLNLVLTKRGKDPSSPPLAGMPYHQVNRYIKELIAKGEKVAICDQLEDPKQAVGVVKRGITSIITQGTLLEDYILPSPGNNYLCSLKIGSKKISLCFVDISTGEFFAVLCTQSNLADSLERYSPRELLIDRETLANNYWLGELLSTYAGITITKRDSYQFSYHESYTRLVNLFSVVSLESFGIEDESEVICSAGGLIAYLEESQTASFKHLRGFSLRTDNNNLLLDRTTIKNLDLFNHSSESKDISLFSVLDKTCTAAGKRLLTNWLLSPSTDLSLIKSRQLAVSELMLEADVLREIRELLFGVYDLERIAARIATEKVTAKDLLALSASIRQLPGLITVCSITKSSLLNQHSNLDPLTDLADLIDSTILPDPANNFKDGGVICSGVSAELDELRDIASGGKLWMTNFQDQEQLRTGIPSLKVGFNKVFGFFIEVSKTHKDKVPSDYERKQTLVSAERYVTSELKQQEIKVLQAEERIVSLEYELFIALRGKLFLEISRIQAVASSLAELDVLANFSEISVVNEYIIPEVHDGLDSSLEDSRHPVLERLLPSGDFVVNDLEFNGESQRLLIITGPNMAGKSTYIRQVALIFIMAQMGCGVPASSATIGLADRIFTRVGANDNLSRGQSTFMVEMIETANILHNATSRSLLILDEIGRGTSTFDGVSLAWSISEYIHEKLKSRTLFATHYHEIAELGYLLPCAKNFNIAIREWGDQIIFLRKIEAGACDRSYGIQVSRLAGIPSVVVDRAFEILQGLENQAAERDWKLLQDRQEILRAAARDVQLELFQPISQEKIRSEEIFLALKQLDTNNLSPIAAHELLGKLINKAKGI